jgi:hypothetical protein
VDDVRVDFAVAVEERAERVDLRPTMLAVLLVVVCCGQTLGLDALVVRGLFIPLPFRASAGQRKSRVCWIDRAIATSGFVLCDSLRRRGSEDITYHVLWTTSLLN